MTCKYDEAILNVSGWLLLKNLDVYILEYFYPVCMREGLRNLFCHCYAACMRKGQSNQFCRRRHEHKIVKSQKNRRWTECSMPPKGRKSPYVRFKSLRTVHEHHKLCVFTGCAYWPHLCHMLFIVWYRRDEVQVHPVWCSYVITRHRWT